MYQWTGGATRGRGGGGFKRERLFNMEVTLVTLESCREMTTRPYIAFFGPEE